MSFPVLVEAHKTYHLHGMNPKRFYDIVVGWESVGWPGQVKIGDVFIDVVMKGPWTVSGTFSSPDNEIAHFCGYLMDIRHAEILKLDIRVESFVDVERFWETVRVILGNVCETAMLEPIIAQHKEETNEQVNAD